jgi:hypothetical protein
MIAKCLPERMDRRATVKQRSAMSKEEHELLVIVDNQSDCGHPRRRVSCCLKAQPTLDITTLIWEIRRSGSCDGDIDECLSRTSTE